MNHAFQKLKLVIFILFSALFFGAISYKLILVSGGPFQEFDAHILFAKKMAEELRPTLPHFLFQAATIIHHGVLSFVPLPTHEIIGTNDKYTYDWGFAAFLVMIETYVGIALLLFFHLIARRQVGENPVGDNSAYFVAFGLSIAAPLFFLAPLDGKYYLGYITPSSLYIIPTQVLLKLPSLALFLLTPTFFSERHFSGGKNLEYLLCVGGLVILSGLAKPNWLLVMLPALIITATSFYCRRRYVNWTALLVIFLCSIILLSWQYYFKFTDPLSPVYKSQILITSPFEVWLFFSDYIFIKLLLSLIFPIAVALLFWHDAKKDFLLLQGWLLLLIGLTYTSFFAESGEAKFAGNFFWCGYIACFMLFVSSASFIFQNWPVFYKSSKRKATAALFVFGLHVICGLIYYFRSFSSSFM